MLSSFIDCNLKPREYIGNYDISFRKSDVVSKYSNNIKITYEEGKVILRVSTFTNAIQKAYCLISPENAQNTFCETTQSFDVKGPGIPVI